jgi:hypothetical protein
VVLGRYHRGPGGEQSRSGLARTASQPLCCFLRSGPVCTAAGRPPGPGEPNQCWTWRWCLNALWGTSNGNSRWVSVGSSVRILRSLVLLSSAPFRFWYLPLTPTPTPRPPLAFFVSSTVLASGIKIPAPTARIRLSVTL